VKDLEVAGKTGTSQDYRDGWFIGYSSQVVAGVWFGNDDSSPTKRLSGANMPVVVWSEIMREFHKGERPAPLPMNWREPGNDRTPAASDDRAGAVAAPSAPPSNANAQVPPAAPRMRETPRAGEERIPASALVPPADLGTSGRQTTGGGLFDRLLGR
jgi:penicillin-binding protein 1A